MKTPPLLCLLATLLQTCFSVSASAWADSCQPRSMNLADNHFEARVVLYRPESPSPRPILIIPPTGGTNFMDRSYARNFCNAGFEVQILAGWSNDDEFDLELGIHRRFYDRAQRAIALALKNFHNGTAVGVLGTSVGAIHAAIAADRFPEISSVFSIVGGASVADIIADSDEKTLTRVRELRFAKFGYHSRAEYARELKKVITLEPSEIRNRKSGQTFGMVIADRDTTVPTRTQLLLRDLWKPGKEIHFNTSHVCAVLRTWLLESQTILAFFQQDAKPHL